MVSKKPVEIRTPLTCSADIEQAIDDLVVHEPKFAIIASDVRTQIGPLPLRAIPAGFAGIARIIVGQQVSAKAAAVIFARLENEVTPLSAEQYLRAGEPAWIKAGLSRPKQRALVATAEAIISGTLNLEDLHAAPCETAIQTMCQVKGVGPWTAEVYLLFAAGHPDIFPARDLALAEAMRRFKGLKNRPAEKRIIMFAKKWSPYRSIAARLFWAHYALDPAAVTKST